MWKFLKNIFLLNDPHFQDQAESTSIHKMVSYNSLNKRKNTRIKYPHFGACGPYPRVFYSGTEMIVANVSVGGVLIIDDTEAFGTEVGDVVAVELIWDDFSTKIRSRVVGINMQRRHLQFVDFNAQAFLRISRLVKPGYLGNRFHIVKDDVGSLQATELWIGPTGENLTFFGTDKIAELTLNGQKLTFTQAKTILYNETALAPYALIEEALVIVANFPESTHNTKKLLDILELNLKNVTQKKSGTHG